MNILIWQLEIIRPADQEVLYQLFFLTDKERKEFRCPDCGRLVTTRA